MGMSIWMVLTICLKRLGIMKHVMMEMLVQEMDVRVRVFLKMKDELICAVMDSDNLLNSVIQAIRQIQMLKTVHQRVHYLFVVMDSFLEQKNVIRENDVLTELLNVPTIRRSVLLDRPNVRRVIAHDVLRRVRQDVVMGVLILIE